MAVLRGEPGVKAVKEKRVEDLRPILQNVICCDINADINYGLF